MTSGPAPLVNNVSPPPRRRCWRRWLVALCLMAVVAWFARSVILGPIVARVVAHQLSLALNGAATVNQASGGWLNDLQLTGVVAQGSPLGPVPLVAVRQVKATYNHGLLFGELDGLRSVMMEGFELELDLRGRKPEQAAVGEHWPALLQIIPQPFPLIDIRGKIQLMLPQDNTIAIEDFALTSEQDQIALRVPVVRINDTVSLPIVVELRRVEPHRLQLVRPFAMSDITVQELVLNLGDKDQSVEAKFTIGKGDLAIDATPQHIHVVADHVDLAAIPTNILTLLPPELSAIAGTVSTDVTLVHGQFGWSLIGSLRLHDCLLAGVGPFQMSSQVQMTAAQIHLPQLQITGPAGGEVVIDGLAIDLRERRPMRGEMSINLPEVNAWWPTFLPALPAPIRAKAHANVTGSTLTFNQAEMMGGGATVLLAGSMAANPWRIEAADLSVTGDLAHLPTWFPLAPKASGTATVRLQGQVPLTSELKTWLASPLFIEMNASHLDFPRVGVDHINLKAKTDGGGVRLEQGLLAIAGTTISTAAFIRPGDDAWVATWERAQIIFPALTANLAQPTEMTFGMNGLSLTQCKLESLAGQLMGTATLNNEAGSITLNGTHLDLEALGYDQLKGKADFHIEINGPWKNPRGRVRFQAPLLSIGATSIRVDVDVHQDAGGITFDRGQMTATDIGSFNASGTMPFILGEAGLTTVPFTGQPAAVDLSIPHLAQWIPNWVIGGDINLQLQMKRPDDSLTPMAVEGNLVVNQVRLRDLGAQTPGRKIPPPSVLTGKAAIHGDLSGVKAQIEIMQGERSILTAEAISSGEMKTGWLFDGSWRKRAWQVQGKIKEFDLTQVAGAIPGILHLAGKITGDWTANGDFETLTGTGSLGIDGAEAKIANDIPTLSAGQARLSIDGNILRLDSLGVDLGGSPVNAHGQMVLGRIPQVQMAIDGRNVLLIQRHDARLRADLDLVLQGPLDQLVLQGKAHVISAVFNPDLSLFSQGSSPTNDGRLLLFELEDPLLSALRFDVAVTSSIDPKDEGVRIATDVVRARCDFDLHLGGTGATPELAGHILAREGRVFLPFSTLRITQGEILFPPADPFQPRISVAAQAQVRRYTVQLQVSGLLSDPHILASGDGLDQRDALLLLTTGSTSAELTQENGQRAALGRVGGWLGLEAWRLVEGPENPDAGPGLFDRFTLDMGRQVSDSGLDTIEAQVELTPPEQRPGVYLYGERDRWDEYNLGLMLRFSWGGDQ